MANLTRLMIRLAVVLTTLPGVAAAHAGDGEVLESAKAAIAAKLIRPDSALQRRSPH